MSAIQNGIPLNHPNLKPLDIGKLKMFNIAEASEGHDQRFMQATEGFLDNSHAVRPDLSNNSGYREYANVTVNGKIAATLDNYGFLEMPNRQAANLDMSGLPGGINGQKGPMLAQARADYIAGQLGGRVEKSVTAMTHAEYNVVPEPRVTVNQDAKRADPMFAQLQQARQTGTAYMAQQAAQEEHANEAENQVAKADPTREFLEYMNMTPEERFYEAVLRDMGLTREALEAMPPEERAKIEEEIKEKMLEKMAKNMRENTEQGEA